MPRVDNPARVMPFVGSNPTLSAKPPSISHKALLMEACPVMVGVNRRTRYKLEFKLRIIRIVYYGIVSLPAPGTIIDL